MGGGKDAEGKAEEENGGGGVEKDGVNTGRYVTIVPGTNTPGTGRTNSDVTPPITGIPAVVDSPIGTTGV